jgi:hypothetical protein
MGRARGNAYFGQDKRLITRRLVATVLVLTAADVPEGARATTAEITPELPYRRLDAIMTKTAAGAFAKWREMSGGKANIG